MRMLGTLLLSSVLAIACRPVAPTGPSVADVRAAIEAQNAKLGEAVRAKDPAAIGALYSVDGRLLPPNAPAVSGREGITAFWQAELAAGVADAKLVTDEVSVTGDLAAEVGHVAIAAADGTTLDEAKYIVLWKQADGAWHLHRDIWNSSRAPAPAKPADAPAEGAAAAGAQPAP